MALKETIACIGLEEEIYPAFIQRLANARYRILLISEKEEQLAFHRENIVTAFTEADVEAILCAREGCWEADIIFLGGETIGHGAIIDKISDVATQKIVVGLFPHDNLSTETRTEGLRKRLPHASVIELRLDPVNTEATLSAEDTQALATLKILLQNCGIQVKQQSAEPISFTNPNNCL